MLLYQNYPGDVATYSGEHFLFRIISILESTLPRKLQLHVEYYKEQNKCHMYDMRILDTCVCEEGKRRSYIQDLQAFARLSREHFEFGLRQMWNSILMPAWHRDRGNPYEEPVSRAIHTDSNRVTRERRCIVYSIGVRWIKILTGSRNKLTGPFRSFCISREGKIVEILCLSKILAIKKYIQQNDRYFICTIFISF